MKRLIPILAVMAMDADAHAADYCTSGTDFITLDTIPVVLNNQMASTLCVGQSTCTSQGDIEKVVKATLAEWTNATGANVRFTFAGSQATSISEKDGGEVIDGKVHIFALPCDGNVLARATHDEGGPDHTWGKIRICSHNGDSGDVPVYWVPYFENYILTDNPRSLHHVLLHELGHVLNLDHQEDCAGPVSPTSSSIMSTPYYDSGSAQLGFPDIDFANDMYGPRSELVSRRSSTDGLTWTEQTNSAPSSFADVRGRMAVSNQTATGTSMLMAYTTDDGATPVVRIRRITGSTWSTIRSLVTISTYPPGIAQASNSIIYNTFLYISHLGTHEQHVYQAKTTNGGSTWSGLTELTTPSTRTRHAGVTSTYDFGTGKFVTMWRGFGNNGDYSTIYYRVEDGGGPYVLTTAFGGMLRSADTPSIACGQPSVVGAHNCLIAWTNGDSWSRTTLWTQAYISGDQIVIPLFNSIKTHPYATASGATVAYVGGSTYPWQISLSQGGTAVYTWRKAPAWSASWVDQRSFAESPGPTPPATGGASGTRWIFVTDE